MLRELQIENYAIIKSLKLTFNDGFTAITGETGAGKSILVGALSLILGNRADTSLLYDKTKKCIVEGTFDLTNLNLKPFFISNDLDYQDLTTLRREISEIGKSRAFINDTPVNLNQIKELASALVDIHSQHNHLLLENQNFQFQVIDDFTGTGNLVSDYKTKLTLYKQKDLQLQSLIRQHQKSVQEKDYLEFLSQELYDAKLSPGEQEEIEKQIAILANAELIKNNLSHTISIISIQDGNIIDYINELRQLLFPISRFDTKIDQILQRIDSLMIECKDIDFELTRIENEVELNPETLNLLMERNDLLNRLQQKHRVANLEELIAIENEINIKLTQFSDLQSQIETVQMEQKELQQHLYWIGKQISQKRENSIPSLEKSIEELIATIGMPDGKVKFQLIPTDQLLDNGIDQLQFLFSANKGTPLMDVEKVASGGEISRLMLAIKTIVAKTAALPTLIFDEIDTGISGDIAAKVAKLMNKIAEDRQLLTITHLPQIAAKASKHYFVYKEVIDNMTYTNVKEVKDSERVDAIAAMISGDFISESSKKTAQELILQN
ncbi:MAG: repair protein RecN [Bacteroidetes bacterium]|nr:repair protein RecN [Bacteroidota bacterium]